VAAILSFDDPEASRRVEATYTTPDVVEQRRAVRAALALKAGERVLDIGSGPGMLACEMAEDVGATGSVDGLDPSESMLAIARRRAAAAATTARVDFAVGDAASLPYGDAAFDAVVTTQVYEYLDDVPAALAEVHRVLRPGGRLLVLDTDWDSIVWHASDAQRMRRVLVAWDEHLANPYLPRTLTRLLRDAGFSVSRREVIPLLNAGYDENSFSAGLIGFIRAFVPGRHGLTEADAAAWADDLVALKEDYFFSLNRYVFLAVR
jgi:arsenite methyltransferase